MVINRDVVVCKVLSTISYGERVAALGIGEEPLGRVWYPSVFRLRCHELTRKTYHLSMARLRDNTFARVLQLE